MSAIILVIRYSTLYLVRGDLVDMKDMMVLLKVMKAKIIYLLKKFRKKEKASTLIIIISNNNETNVNVNINK